jgi:hypothetical protein
MTRSSFLDRLRGALRLDVRVVQELKMSPSANVQALFVLVVVSAMAGVGITAAQSLPWGRVWWPMAMAAAGWIVWATLVWVLGTHLWPDPKTSATLPQALRPLAFATAPAAGAVLLVIPYGVGIGLTVFFAGWGLLTVTVAIRHPLRYPNTAKALGVLLAASILFGGAVTVGLWALARWGSPF